MTALPDTSRLLAPELAGGALLDLGPYPLVWVRHLDLFAAPYQPIFPGIACSLSESRQCAFSAVDHQWLHAQDSAYWRRCIHFLDTRFSEVGRSRKLYADMPVLEILYVTYNNICIYSDVQSRCCKRARVC
jgi:hypothetical protein